MSIDIDWHTLTAGPDGAALAESIRAFVHDRFQQIQLPRMLRSVKVDMFDFGSTPPDIQLRDVCDPLPDFYDDDTEDGPADTTPGREASHDAERTPVLDHHTLPQHAPSWPSTLPLHQLRVNTDAASARGLQDQYHHQPLLSPTFSTNGAGTPRAFMGGISNHHLGYFHLPLSAGLSGTSTPLAAVAGGVAAHQSAAAWLDTTARQLTRDRHDHRSSSFGAYAGSVTPPSRPASQQLHQDWPGGEYATSSSHAGGAPSSHDGTEGSSSRDPPSSSHSHGHRRRPTPSPDDLQVVARIRYDGDVRLSLACEILLDYPMESFVGIPLQLRITGLRFDGIAIAAYVRTTTGGGAADGDGGERKAHFCFLAPEDAEVVVDDDDDGHDGQGGGEDEDGAEGERVGEDRGTATGEGMAGGVGKREVGGLIEEIKVESEIGQKESGRQVLKNVGKVEKFVLEQVRRIFEEEFIYPSFWTFLV